MFSSQINFIEQLSYRQIQSQLRKRQLNSSGKKFELVKRFKVAYEKEYRNQTMDRTCFENLPNEIYRDIFDYLCPWDIIHSFSELNYRLNQVIKDIPMKLKFDTSNKMKYIRTLKRIVPKLTPQIMALDLGRSSTVDHCFPASFSSKIVIDLFTQLYNFTEFSQLRCLSLISPTNEQLESLFFMIPNLSSLRSLRLFEDNDCNSQNQTVCKLTLANHRPYAINKKSADLKYLSIDTNPPFNILNLLQKYLLNKFSFDFIQLNIHCVLYFYPQALIPIKYDGLSRLISNFIYFKIDVLVGPCKAAFDLIQRFPQVRHLCVRTVSKAYANGEQWADLLIQIPNLHTLDLDIALDSDNFNLELQTFQSKFWLERQWFVQCLKIHMNNSSQYKIRHRDNQVR
ncbi:hypothetical protein I4U23_028414 [Adineta vaga]|nr:hypothetical protein I4U23_028414 [Adineta vaga]